jgi:DNA-binding protein HU-beta
VNKSELIDEVVRRMDINKGSVVRAVDMVFDIISETLKKGDSVTLSGFGTFTVSARAARNGRNPRTGQTIAIPPSRSPRFKAGKGLKDALN